MNAICLTTEERERLAALYPPDPEPARLARVLRPHHPPPVNRGPRPSSRGENHGLARLTRAQVISLRTRAAGGKRFFELAREDKLSKVTVRNAVTGITWGWLKDPPPFTPERPGGVIGRIRAALRANALAEWRAPQLAERTCSEPVQARVALHKLWKRGEVKKTGRGLYQATRLVGAV